MKCSLYSLSSRSHRWSVEHCRTGSSPINGYESNWEKEISCHTAANKYNRWIWGVYLGTLNWKIQESPYVQNRDTSSSTKVLMCSYKLGKTFKLKRMHSSGMRTTRLLTVSQYALWWGCTCPGGVPAQGVYLPGWCTCQGCTCLGGVPTWGVPAQVPPSVNRMTDMCKNITFANFVCGR